MKRKDGLYRVNLGIIGSFDRWTFGWWNSQSQFFRIDQQDYRETDISEIDEEWIDPVPISKKL